jgi:succinyl-diaminopimelate desuccinylase
LGREPDFSVSPGSDDQKYVVHKAGIDQCIVYGPGPLSLAHKIDEYVEVEHLVKATKIMAIGALSLLGFKA